MTDDWNEYRRFVIETLKRLEELTTANSRDIVEIRVSAAREAAKAAAKISAIGVALGLIVTVLMNLVWPHK